MSNDPSALTLRFASSELISEEFEYTRDIWVRKVIIIEDVIRVVKVGVYGDDPQALLGGMCVSAVVGRCIIGVLGR